MMRRIAAGQYKFEPHEEAYLSPECMSLIKLMLTRNPKERKSAEELLAHEWFSKYNL
jgi:serine/threonine protein kinase